jgi:hypothetical protein
MKKLIRVFSFTIGFLFFTMSGIAQNDTTATKKFDHYLGFQANELLRQLINFDNTTTEVNNPYLFVYSINKSKTKWGLHTGLGIVYKTIIDNEGGVGRETKLNDWFYRVGAEKKFKLGKKFESNVSLDITGSYKLDKTFSISVVNSGSTIDSSETTVTTKTVSWGGGPRATLGFYISDKVMLSTEATLYFSSENQKENVLIMNSITDIFTGEQTVSTSNFNSEIETNQFSFAIPIALFLVVKF